MNRRLLTALAAVALLGACTPIQATRGNMVDDDRLASIKPGTPSETVLETLGSPTSKSDFGDVTWYYIGQRTEQTAFFAPEPKERKIVAIHFDANGKVTRIDRGDLSQAEAIEPSTAETPTAGQEITFFQQLLGNAGRFSSKTASGVKKPGTVGKPGGR